MTTAMKRVWIFLFNFSFISVILPGCLVLVVNVFLFTFLFFYFCSYICKSVCINFVYNIYITTIVVSLLLLLLGRSVMNLLRFCCKSSKSEINTKKYKTNRSTLGIEKPVFLYQFFFFLTDLYSWLRQSVVLVVREWIFYILFADLSTSN